MDPNTQQSTPVVPAQPGQTNQPISSSPFSPVTPLPFGLTQTEGSQPPTGQASSQPQPSINDLEAEFVNSMKDIEPPVAPTSYSPASSKIGGMEQKIRDLTETDKKIEQKSAMLKVEVGGKLEQLKGLKNDIGTLIDEIKELEETRVKIKEEIAKLEALKIEVANLEQEAKQELS